MSRRGFFAELQYQSRLSERERARQTQIAERERGALQRQLERAQKAEARARSELAKTTETERKRLEKEAREAHIEAMEAEVAQRNRGLQEIYEDIESLLASTLGKDDYVDLSTLRAVAQHPPFNRADLESPIPAPAPVSEPEKPSLKLPDSPRGLAGLFGKRKYEEAVEDAHQAHDRALKEWEVQLNKAAADIEAAKRRHARAEAERLDALRVERARYAKECESREAAAAEQNRKLAELITNLGYGAVGAVQEYVSIVLSNSVYPDHFSVAHEFEFNRRLRSYACAS